MRIFLILLLTILSLASLNGQAQTINFLLIEEGSETPIEAAHIFILNSTIGDFTDAQGKCKLVVPQKMAGQVVISHIAYDNVQINIDDLKILDQICLIKLKQNSSSFNEVVVTSKRDTKWKRHYRTFKKTLLGEGQAAEKCEILNPEVLRFDINENQFRATAIAPLKIKNKYLGYQIEFLLNELIVESDGSRSYNGQASFKDLFSDDLSASISRKREKTYEGSRRHFFRALIEDELNESYLVTINQYSNGEFIELAKPGRADLVELIESTGFYKVHFNDFLQVVNLNLKNIVEAGQKKISGKQTSRFNSTYSSGTSKVDYAVSQLFKIAPFLIVDRYGNVYNTSKVKEYGFWAEQRLATMLPLDYKIENSGLLVSDEVKAIDSDDEKSIVENKNNAVVYEKSDVGLEGFLELLYGNKEAQLKELTAIEREWNDGYYASLLDIVRLSGYQWLVDKVYQILKTKSNGQIVNYYDGLKWLWDQGFSNSAYYSDFRAEIHKHIDPKFEKYFKGRSAISNIRLEEVMWGGVRQDGIPPLRKPKMLEAEAADYLEDGHLVFGIYINGEPRAYPKRILAWHEFFVDEFSGTKVAGVYCTLCGTVIAYDMTYDNMFHDLGTSGFLYRSNKLMYDRATQSLWSTIEGKPVIGPLVGKDIELKSYPVVTTTWGEWRDLHPTTKVLSLKTGNTRNYDEGEAYKKYYADDQLMFPVPHSDQRLKNKAEVLVLKTEGYQQDPVAISIDYLVRNKLYQAKINRQAYVVISEKDGLSKVYEAQGVKFVKYRKGKLVDEEGQEWFVTEEEINSPSGKSLKRLPAHNIFWFAWVNTFPETKLVY